MESNICMGALLVAMYKQLYVCVYVCTCIFMLVYVFVHDRVETLGKIGIFFKECSMQTTCKRCHGFDITQMSWVIYRAW